MNDDIISFSSESSKFNPDDRSRQGREMISPKTHPIDRLTEVVSLRPEGFADYIGQSDTVETLKIAIKAARLRGEAMDHVLLHGPPGLGKSTISRIIANEVGGGLTITSGPVLEKAGDLIGMLTNLSQGDILFIDEIHRLPKTVEEFLYPAMEDFAVDFVFDKGLNARSHRYHLKPFVLIGATTRVGLLSSPLRDRFGIFRSLDFYSVDELVVIIMRSARLLQVEIDRQRAVELAERSRGTPRIANRLLKRVRDFSQVKSAGRVTKGVVQAALALEGIDEQGLTVLDRNYLTTIIDFYKGGPVGIEAVAATLQEETDTLVDVVEPFFLKMGFLMRTSAGRRTSARACEHLRKVNER
ncbi:MAG: Holliday junction branch migration DNA helicase RuvB [Thermodesulfobacteriota bacterium]|nr:Holliday junction branch migration DNA helicase RuvB [Thermodesulfobacteriota bacterium]